MDLMYYALSPFSWLLNFFYSLFENYGFAIILFALVVKLVMFPLSLKGKRSMIAMNMISGKMQNLQKQYGKDKERYNIEVQRLYEKERVNPMGGCLWSMLPLFILLPLYAIIREPLKYMMGLDTNQIMMVAQALDWDTIAVTMNWATPEMIAKAIEASTKAVADGTATMITGFVNNGYNQLYLASLINDQTLPAIHTALGEGTSVFSMNFNFFGLNLAMLPNWKVWTAGLENLGLVVLVLISAGSGVLFSKISMKTNKMNSTQKNDTMDKTNKMMLWTMPIMSLYIGFIMPAGLCLYWIANNLLSMGQEMIAGKILKKDYEAARLASEERERLEKEEEKVRKTQLAEERARRAEEEKKNRGKKKPIKRDEPAEPGINKANSTVGLRAYARGRSYDPDRFGGVTAYQDPAHPVDEDAISAALAAKGTAHQAPEEELETEQPALAAHVEQEPDTDLDAVQTEEIDDAETETDDSQSDEDEDQKEGQ